MTFRLPTTSTLFPYTTLFRSDIEQHLSVSKLGKLVFTQQHHVLVQAADNHLILSKKFLQRQELEAFFAGFFFLLPEKLPIFRSKNLRALEIHSPNVSHPHNTTF